MSWCHKTLCCVVSETTQLAALDHVAVVKLMHIHLFSPALRSRDEVDIAEVKLPETWVEDIWRYIARYFPTSLVPLHGLHILPSRTGKLFKLQTSSAVIVLNHGISTLSDSIQEVCKAVGVRVVKNMICLLYTSPSPRD